MKDFTINEQFVRGLEVRGYREYTAKVEPGYRQFYHPDRKTQRIFVGAEGNFTAGQNRLASLRVSNKFAEEIMAAGRVRLLTEGKTPA